MKIIYIKLLLILFITCLLMKGNVYAFSNERLVSMIEHVVPQYIGSKTASGSNNARTPFAVCLEITGLTPDTKYDVQIGIGLITDAATVLALAMYGIPTETVSLVSLIHLPLRLMLQVTAVLSGLSFSRPETDQDLMQVRSITSESDMHLREEVFPVHRLL